MSQSNDPPLRDFLLSLPKTETHLHLEGALPYACLHELDPGRFPEVASFHDRGFRFRSFPEFEQVLLNHALAWFTSAQLYHDGARAVFARQWEQNIRYVETSFHLPVSEYIRTPVQEIIDAIRSAVPPGLEVRIFAAMARNSYAGALKPVIDRLEHFEGLAGVDLHGDEAMPTEAWTAPAWVRIRAAGLVTKCHAGEFDGAARVREAIESLGATRIQHGVRTIEDPEVVDLARDRGVTLDMCPLSNVRLGVVPDLARHPIRELSAAGIRCTVSTDDPLVFGNTLLDEYEALAVEAGFTRASLVSLVRNGWNVALVNSAQRDQVLRTLEQLAGDTGHRGQ